MKYLISIALLSVLTFHATTAIPLKSASSESSSDSSSSDSSSNESSQESLYLIKKVTYEIGLVDTSDQGNSTKTVVTPEDRIETADIVLWTSSNGHTTENDNTTSASSTEAVLATTQAAPAGAEEINKDTVTPFEVHATSPPSLSATEQIEKETTSSDQVHQ